MQKIKKNNLKSINYKLKANNGFSLIEVLVAVFVITIGFTATTTLISKSIAESIGSRDTIVASQLAQEGIEVVRNIRDQNWLVLPKKKAFEANFTNGNKDFCVVDYDSSALVNGTDCNPSNNFDVYLNANYYEQTVVSATPTKFKRRIGIEYYNAGANPGVNPNVAAYARVGVVVTWDGSANIADANHNPLNVLSANCNIGNKCVFIQDRLTSWND